MSRSEPRKLSHWYDQPQRRTYAQTLADKPLQPSKPQIPCDVGLFGDEYLQLDLIEMLQDPDPQ